MRSRVAMISEAEREWIVRRDGEGWPDVLVEVQEEVVVMMVSPWCYCQKGPSRRRRANSDVHDEMFVKCSGLDRRGEDGGPSAFVVT
jgi:hypothetical protein